MNDEAKLTEGSCIQVLGLPGIWMIDRFVRRAVIVRRIGGHQTATEIGQAAFGDARKIISVNDPLPQAGHTR